MPTVDTLVEDIQSLISDPKAFSEANIKSFGEALAQRLGYRLSETRGSGTLRVSNLGKPCDRQLWYDVHRSSDREPLPASARLKFLFGDILEELLLFLAREAGHDVKSEQSEITINGVTGHLDAIIDGRVVDVKSASTYAFKKFSEHGLQSDDPFGYLDQGSAYVYGSGDNPDLRDRDVVSFLAVDKQLGHLVLDTYPVTGKNYDKIVEDKRTMLSKEEPPERAFQDEPFQKGGNRKLCVTCSYCPFKFSCWENLRVFNYANKPVFLTTVAKEPKVAETIGP